MSSYVTKQSTTKISALHLLISSAIIASLLAVITISLHIQSVVAANVDTSQATKVIKKTAKPVKTQTSIEKTAPSIASKAARPQNCTIADTPAQPEAIDLSSAKSGLTQIIDAPMYYQVFGNTAAQVLTQLRSCAPLSSGGEQFVGEAAYTISWQYTTHTTQDNLCEPRNVRVGLHTNMTLPSWSATPEATPGLADKWNKFMNNLVLHENGHIALNKEHAARLLANLQANSAADCAALKASMRNIAQTALNTLDAANVTYDHNTDHGATQGAVLPR